MKMRFVDDLKRSFEVVYPPRRIISLCPSITQTLYDLDLAEQVVGRTEFCPPSPREQENAKTIGGTKNVNIDLVRSLAPDLIIAEKEENTRNKVEKLAREFPVCVYDIENYDSALRMIRSLGNICNRQEKSHAIIDEIEREFARLTIPEKPLRTLYFIWKDPWMIAGHHTFINAILSKAGFLNPGVKIKDHRYPKIDKETIRKLKPQLVLLSDEPFPFGDEHMEEFRFMLPESRVLLIDGKIFSWYGSQMRKTPHAIQEIFDRI